jgi:hypothetical protein
LKKRGEASLDCIIGPILTFFKWFADGHAPGEVAYWTSQIVLALIALIAAAIAYRQVNAFGALELVKFMQQDNVRSARWHVRTVLINKPLADWDTNDREKASTVCSSFDLMGFLVSKKLAPRQAYIKLYAITVQRMHHILSGYLAQERDPARNGPHFWEHFTWLSEKARRIEPFKPS